MIVTNAILFLNMFLIVMTSTSTKNGTSNTSTTNTNFMYNYNEPNSDWIGTCSNGKEQSPIDFPSNFTYYKQEEAIRIGSSSYGQYLNGLVNGTLSFVNNRYIFSGEKLGSLKIIKNGILYLYNLDDISFHLPSEHKFIGFNGSLEMHLHHTKNTVWSKDNNLADLDPRNTKLIIAVVFKVGSFYDNPNIARLNVDNRVTNGVLNFNVGVFPPIGKPFLYYEGSSTIPPCEQNVNWLVVHKMELISPNQYNSFLNWIKTSNTNYNTPTLANARQTKPLNSRQIYYQIYPNQIAIELSSVTFRLSLFLVLLCFFFMY